MSRANLYCHALGIQVPRLEMAKSGPDANYYSLLIVALLERGGPITLEEAAKRLEEAGVAPPGCALASLKRCKPARPPIYRDGDRYALDPHDHEADLWAFRLGLRPPQIPALQLVRPDARPLPSADESLTVEALDEAWRRAPVDLLVRTTDRDLRARRPRQADAPRRSSGFCQGACNWRALPDRVGASSHEMDLLWWPPSCVRHGAAPQHM